MPLTSDGDVDGLISLNERMFNAFEVLEEHSKCIDARSKIVKFWIDVENKSKNDCYYLLGKVADNTVAHIQMIQFSFTYPYDRNERKICLSICLVPPKFK